MTNPTVAAIRAGQSNVPQGVERLHTLIFLIEDRPGSVDRVVGVLRRRRAKALSLALAPTAQANVVRITAQVKDSEVAIEQLVEQLRKIVDVHHLENLTAEQAILREVALVQLNATTALFGEVVAFAQQFGAAVVDATAETVTFEITGDQEKLEKFLQAAQSYGIREVARSGAIAIARGSSTL